MNRLNRREFLKLGAGTVAAGILAGCGPVSPQAPGKAAAPTIKRGGTLMEAMAFTYPTLNSQLTNNQWGIAFSALYDALLRYEMVDEKSARFEFKPGLAESWTQEPKAIVMQLRKGVKFHDGSDFNAEVAKWNLDIMRTDKRGRMKEVMTGVESVDVLGSHSIRLNLLGPTPTLLLVLSQGYENSPAAINSKVAMEKLGEDGFARNPVGTGPFRFKQWITDDRVILERNPDYWMQGVDGKSLPYLDQLVSRYVSDPSVSLLELKSGGLHLVDAVLPKDVPTVKGDPNLVYWEMPWGGVGYFNLCFNYKSGPFSNLKLRQAANHALDLEAMVKVVAPGVGQALRYPRWNSGQLGYDESVPTYPYNLDRAKQLVQEAGLPSGFEVRLSVIGREPENTIGQIAADMWGKAGIKTKLLTQERLAWIDSLAKGDFDSGFSRYIPEPDSDFKKRAFSSGGAGNWNAISNPEIDRLMEEAGSTYDTNKRQQLYKQVLTIVQENAYLAPGFLTPGHKVFRKELKGLTVQNLYTDPRTAWLDL